MENLPDAIASTHDILEELTITQNGEYLPSEGVDGFSKVTAEFDISSLPKVKVHTFRVTDACINEDGIWGGENLIDTSECTSFFELFRNAKKLKNIDCSSWNTSKVTHFGYVFSGCSNLEMINLIGWDASNATTAGDMLYAGAKLKSIIGGETIENVLSKNISCLDGCKIVIGGIWSSGLDRASLRAIINGLADLTGQTAQRLVIGAPLIAKLTEEDIAIATSKNWTIA